MNGKLSFDKDATIVAFKNDQNPEVPMVTPTWAAIWGYGLFGTKGEGGYRNGVSADIVEADSGKYDLILSEGEWNVYQTEIRFYHQKWMDLCGDGKLRYVNSNMNVADYSRSSRNNQQIALSAGQELNSNNFLFESGAATIKFFINGSGKMENPRLDATSSDSSERSVGLLGVGIATSTDGSTGEATIIGPPGTYNLTARAIINGTLTTFGDLKITLVAGACQSFEIGAPTLMLDVVNNCNNEVTVSGKATDKAVPIQSVQVNGQNIAFTATGNADNEVSFSITLPLQAGENKIETAVTNNAGKTASDSRTVNAYPAGAFIVGDEGIVKIDWLYDGGKYQGQFGIFSLDGMSQFTPGSPEFITEAVNRVLSDTEQGYLVFSDLEEGARFSGILGHEIRDWNAGSYKGVKSFPMKPGSCFATVLVPNSTFSSLSQNPATTDTNKRPLFSLVSANSAYGMVMGQMADVNGMGKAYSYEDKNAETSDRDFNDLIVQITGATGDLPTIDSLRSDRSSRDKREYGDWRDSAFGQLILEHVEASEVTETTPHITVTLASSAADMVIYDPQKRFIGKDGGTIPGAAFEMKSGVQIVSLAALTAGDYRIVLRSVGDGGSGTLEITGFVGSTQVASEQMPFEIAAHQSLDSVLSADAFLSSQTIAVEIPGVNELGYDFNGDGVTDNADVALIVRHWNSCRNQQKYDPFFDLNDDGCITVADVMKVLNAKTVK